MCEITEVFSLFSHSHVIAIITVILYCLFTPSYPSMKVTWHFTWQLVSTTRCQLINSLTTQPQQHQHQHQQLNDDRNYDNNDDADDDGDDKPQGLNGMETWMGSRLVLGPYCKFFFSSLVDFSIVLTNI